MPRLSQSEVKNVVGVKFEKNKCYVSTYWSGEGRTRIRFFPCDSASFIDPTQTIKRGSITEVDYRTPHARCGTLSVKFEGRPLDRTLICKPDKGRRRKK